MSNKTETLATLTVSREHYKRKAERLDAENVELKATIAKYESIERARAELARDVAEYQKKKYAANAEFSRLFALAQGKYGV